MLHRVLLPLIAGILTGWTLVRIAPLVEPTMEELLRTLHGIHYNHATSASTCKCCGAERAAIVEFIRCFELRARIYCIMYLLAPLYLPSDDSTDIVLSLTLLAVILLQFSELVR